MFSHLVTEAITQNPRITIVPEEVTRIPDGPTVIATGPPTADALAKDIARLVGDEYLYFYDAIAPTVIASIDS